MVFGTFLERVFPSQGLMLLDPSGRLIQSSPKARRLCRRLQAQSAVTPIRPTFGAPVPELPLPIQQLVRCLIESRELFPDQRVQLQDEISLEEPLQVHVCAEWIDLDAPDAACIVIILEDPQEVAQKRAVLDAYRYHFTPREAEVWELSLKGHSYRQIAEDLFISLNTVKRHMKSILTKRKSELWGRNLFTG